ncbi:unnamed protein product [Calypogeia fissa]
MTTAEERARVKMKGKMLDKDSDTDSLLGGHSDADKGPVKSRSSDWFIFLLSLSAGLGGFLFGYDTGVISGALLYIRDDFEVVDRSLFLQETIVSTAILGAVLGALIGGRMNDRLGRKPTILVSDAVFTVGALLMALAPDPYFLIGGRLVVGFGIGIASMTIPLYIAEASPPEKRGALVTVNVLMITTGQFLSYVVNYAFTTVPGTWRWMLGVAAAPAILQAVLFICLLPESPRWLASQKKLDEAFALLQRIHTPAVARVEIAEIQATKGNAGQHPQDQPKLIDMLKRQDLRLALTAGIGIQIFQQLAGINTVMYYSPSIVQQAGFASHQIALLLSSGIAGMNAIGTILGIVLIDRTGRRKLALLSLSGIVAALVLLAAAFHLAALKSPSVTWPDNTTELGLVCPALSMSGSPVSATCMTCLTARCGFCGDSMYPGTCLIYNGTSSVMCIQSSRSWYTDGCPSNYGWLALLGLVLYIAAFAPGMGPVPWAVNAEIYPQQYRGLGGGAAATANWISNFVVAQTFLTLVDYWGPASTFLLCAGISAIAMCFVAIVVPETKGLTLQGVEKMWVRTIETGGLLGNWYRGGWAQVEDDFKDSRTKKNKAIVLH